MIWILTHAQISSCHVGERREREKQGEERVEEKEVRGGSRGRVEREERERNGGRRERCYAAVMLL